jgi:hypothetical protein
MARSRKPALLADQDAWVLKMALTGQAAHYLAFSFRREKGKTHG